MQEIIRLFRTPLQEKLMLQTSGRWGELQEIRIRVQQPLELCFNQGVEWVTGILPTNEDALYMLNQLSEFSIYRLEDELREGFITINGGHRIGLSGSVNTEGGSIKAIKHVTSFNIRIAKEQIGAAAALMPFLIENDYVSTLLVGPPQTGKTTLLRDIVRSISGGWKHYFPRKTAVIDERSEIGGSIQGVPQHNLGKRTDIMDACPKADAMMMMIRSMSPDVLVADEIGSAKDVQALLEAIHAGVTIICSVHGDSYTDIHNRPSLRTLLEQQIFKRVVILKKAAKPGTIAAVYNNHGQQLQLPGKRLS